MQEVTVDILVSCLSRSQLVYRSPRPAWTCQAASDKEKAIKDAEATKKKAEAVLFSGYVMGSTWSMCKEGQC